MSPFSKVLLLVAICTVIVVPFGNHSIDINPSADDPKINLNGSVDDGHLINLHQSAEDQFNQSRSADEQIANANVNCSAPVDHICSPNPSQPGSFCLNCDIHNCSNQTTKDHLCLCQRGEIWKNCDEAELESTNSTAKVPENICAFVNSCGQFGSCVPDSDYPGFNCICDAEHAGKLCDWDKDVFDGLDVFEWVLYNLILIYTFIVIVILCVKHHRRVKITPANGMETVATQV